MYPYVAIATRNNPIGLSCLLGSIARYPLSVIISDSSDTPVLANPQIARISGKFLGGIHYRHSVFPCLLQQRVSAVEHLGDDDWCLFLDDDLLYKGDVDLSILLGSIAEHAKTSGYEFVQGYKQDWYNDRGYPDFGLNAITPHHDPSVPQAMGRIQERGFLDVDDCDPFRFDGGVFCTRKKTFMQARERAFHRQPLPCIPAGVEDDVVVQILGTEFKSVVSVPLYFTHYGNDNQNWSALADKQYAVDVTQEHRP